MRRSTPGMKGRTIGKDKQRDANIFAQRLIAPGDA